MKVLIVFLLCVVAVCPQAYTGPKHSKVVACYLTSWAVYRPDPGQFSLDNLEPALCTHLVYSFAGIDETTHTIKSLDPWQDLDDGKATYRRLVALKQRYPHLKVTLAIGGWDEGSLKFSNMASKPESRATFIQSVLSMLTNYQFDGLDLNWKYPTQRDGKPYDRENFILLVKELSEAFKPRGLILTAALGALKFTIQTAYDLAKLNPYVDLVYIMTYDYHGSWDRLVGANAPLRGLDVTDVMSVDYTINYMISHGLAPHKLVLGLPMFGRTFFLVNPETRFVEYGSTPARERGFQGPFTREDGFMAYNEICSEISNKSSKWEYHWHDRSSTPYLRDGGKVIVYDNGRSMANKVHLAIDKGLAGVMVWSVDNDDFKGNCEPETNSYVDFEKRYHRLLDDPLLNQGLQKVGLLDENQVALNGPLYVLQNNSLHLRLPQPKNSNYPMMQTINDAMVLAVQEKTIDNAIAEATAASWEKGIFYNYGTASKNQINLSEYPIWFRYL